MSIGPLCDRAEQLRLAISERDWTRAEQIADELERALREILRGASKENRVHRDGLYVVGWQHTMSAPRHVQRAVERYNTALRRISEYPGARRV